MYPIATMENQSVNVETLRKNRKNPILVIDDDADIRVTIGEYLESRGYNVVYADNGVNGVNLPKNFSHLQSL